MPYLGLSSFLQTGEVEYDYSGLALFQCPTSGFLLFYTNIKLVYDDAEELFQCPTSGFLLFYEALRNVLRLSCCVSMPYLGLSSFLH